MDSFGYAFITIPAAVTKIEDCAFDGCTSLKEVHVKAAVPPVIFSGTFGYISGNLKVYVPAASIDAYRAADYWNELNLLAE